MIIFTNIPKKVRTPLLSSLYLFAVEKVVWDVSVLVLFLVTVCTVGYGLGTGTSLKLEHVHFEQF
jgi:hypothetical protein